MRHIIKFGLLLLALQIGTQDLPTTVGMIPTPIDYQRVTVAADSFAAWLRNLPLASLGRHVGNP
jgi:hypothetical protein